MFMHLTSHFSFYAHNFFPIHNVCSFDKPISHPHHVTVTVVSVVRNLQFSVIELGY